MASPPASVPPSRDVTVRRQQTRALGYLAVAALAALVRLALPVGVGLFLGALIAFTLQPAYEHLRKRLPAGPAALVCALGSALTVTAFVVAFTAALVTHGLAFLGTLPAMLAPGGVLRSLAQRTADKLLAMNVDVGNISERLESEVLSLGSRVAGIAAQIAGLSLGALLTLFFMALATYAVLRNWNTIATRAEIMLPFDRRHTHGLLDQFRTAGRQVLLGTVVTGIVQGLFAAIGYWVTGVPQPAFFGALTAVASLVPGVGTLIIWVTVGVVRVLTGHVAAGLVELTYSALTVGIVSDYVIRPRLVGSERGVPSILMFIALFGGIEVFGIIGLILGPIIVTLAVAVLRLYVLEVSRAQTEA